MKRKLFKNKEKRKQFFILSFAILVGAVFILEIIAFPLLYREPATETKTHKELEEKFAEQWIFEENLTEQERDFLVERGITIASYYYIDNSGFYELESLVNSMEGQLILEKIKSNETKVELNSIMNTLILENLTHDKLFKGLCETLYYPPADCISFVE